MNAVPYHARADALGGAVAGLPTRIYPVVAASAFDASGG